MSKFVVSANYRDRNSPRRWLIRGVNEPIEAAIAWTGVIAKNLRFQDSPEAEAGFGCGVVAIAEFAEGTEDPDAPQCVGERLEFSWPGDFLVAGTRERVTHREIAELHLHKDGFIYADVKPRTAPPSEPAVV